MKIKYTGDQDEITIRNVTFPKGKAVVFNLENAPEALLAKKVLALPDFEEVVRKARK
ncbi:MAG: hypothetical protein ACPG4X_19355 [Pikeienuella sp.]